MLINISREIKYDFIIEDNFCRKNFIVFDFKGSESKIYSEVLYRGQLYFAKVGSKFRKFTRNFVNCRVCNV
jgi:mRNA-degrading endonuclease HigB of HigAB toxin-antitoxin module